MGLELFHKDLRGNNRFIRDYFVKLVLTPIIPTPNMSNRHPIFYSQILREGSLSAIWCDLTLFVTLMIGTICNIVLIRNPFKTIQTLFVVRAFMMAEISIYEVEYYLKAKSQIRDNGKSLILKIKSLAILVIFISISNTCTCLGQITEPKSPQFNTYTPVSTDQSFQHFNSGSNSNSFNSTLQPSSPESSQNVNSQTPNQVFERLNKNNSTLNAKSFIPPKQIQTVAFVKSLIVESNATDEKVNYTMPRLSSESEKLHFEKAYNEIVEMLEGKKPLSIKRAVFLTENAWFSGQMNYKDFCAALDESEKMIEIKMSQEGLSSRDNHAINYMTHKYISDTLRIDMMGLEKVVTTFPKQYDFDDPFGYYDVRQMFVSKLMFENSGQCKSLPLYYLILVEELGGSAYLSLSPSHSFIKVKDNKGNFYNVELTNGRLSSDSWIVGSGYIKAEAIKGGIYLDTMNKEQVVANCLTDLAQYYKWRFGKPDIQQGYEDFNLKCINQTLKYHPNNINAILEKSNYYSVLLEYVIRQKGYSTEDQILSDPKTKEIFIQRNKLYALTDGLGYEPMPEEIYSSWLKTIEEKQQEQEHNKFYINFSKIVTNK
ncbi:hypothetical protein [Parvicella tangerina]|uniref:Protein SirB1 N-terminal domain-containing protein n=1 Tax=Parvicella tangerina TaxID=2829795 RepID=A0A916JQH5_9FLAO|nr:hypothetical protein [Parvicella tangerina]CAG5086806.1 hypothetical protein CRYO30217_03288 [Parvicella tangerina]